MNEPQERVTVVKTGSGGGGIAVIALVLVFGLGAFVFFGTDLINGGSKSIDINVDIPKVEVPVAPKE